MYSIIYKSWRPKYWQYKRCSKCGSSIKYENIIDLYLLKDNDATWNCTQCNHQESISIAELLIYYQQQSKTA